MKHLVNAQRVVLLLAIVVAIIGFSAFRQKDSTRKQPFRENYTKGSEDTTRNKRNRSKDEYYLIELNQAMKQLDVQMSNMERQLKTMDFSKIERQVNDEIKKIDVDKISKEVELAMQEVDLASMKTELNKATAAIKKVDSENMKKEMEKVKVDLQKHKEQWHMVHEKFSKNLKDEMHKLKGEMVKLGESMKQLSAFTDALHNDKLIDKNKPYSIEVKEGELYIDGLKQSPATTDKYKSFFKDKNFSIKNDGDSVQKARI